MYPYWNTIIMYPDYWNTVCTLTTGTPYVSLQEHHNHVPWLLEHLSPYQDTICTLITGTPYRIYCMYSDRKAWEKQCRPRWDAAECGVIRVYTVFHSSSNVLTQNRVVNCTCSNFRTNMVGSWSVRILRVNMVSLYHTCLNIWTHSFYALLMCLNSAGWVANSVDPDQMPHSGSKLLVRPICLNNYGKYCNNPKYQNRQTCPDSVDPVQMLHSVASDQGLHYLPTIQQYFRYINRLQNGLFQILEEAWQTVKVTQYFE